MLGIEAYKMRNNSDIHSVCLFTSDGSAKGGSTLADGADFVATDGELEFKHSESSKTVVIDCADPKVCLSYVIVRMLDNRCYIIVLGLSFICTK